MIDKKGHIKLTDFGLSQLNTLKEFNLEDKKKNNKSDKIFGSANYLAPELILQTSNGKTVDYWALGKIEITKGVIIYELIVGEPPFNDETTEKIFDNILKLRINWPKVKSVDLINKDEETCISQDAFSLIKGLLTLDPSIRLGFKSINQIKTAKFFESNSKLR